MDWNGLYARKTLDIVLCPRLFGKIWAWDGFLGSAVGICIVGTGVWVRAWYKYMYSHGSGSVLGYDSRYGSGSGSRSGFVSRYGSKFEYGYSHTATVLVRLHNAMMWLMVRGTMYNDHWGKMVKG